MVHWLVVQRHIARFLRNRCALFDRDAELPGANPN